MFPVVWVCPLSCGLSGPNVSASRPELRFRAWLFEPAPLRVHPSTGCGSLFRKRSVFPVRFRCVRRPAPGDRPYNWRIVKTRDLRVDSICPLIPPEILLEELPLSQDASAGIALARDELRAILDGRDDRLIIVVGPCSIHDPVAGLDYGTRLARLAGQFAGDLRLIMRVYFEKPRTTVGWKGLINDPHLDGSFVIIEGLRTARKLLLDLAELGLPAGCEFLDPITPQFTSD